jgi:hypothetical protein
MVSSQLPLPTSANSLGQLPHSLLRKSGKLIPSLNVNSMSGSSCITSPPQQIIFSRSTSPTTPLAHFASATLNQLNTF